MIARVLLNGADVELDEVFAELTIRHGRGSVDDTPLASTATLRLVDVDRAAVAAFSAGDTLDVLLEGDVPRFVGRVTDATDSVDGLTIIAVSSISWLSRRVVGGSDWPQESWYARLLRVFQDAGILLTYPELGGSWASAAGSWVDYGTAGRLTLEHADNGPMIAARVASTETLAGYLSGEFAECEAAAVANLPDGTVLVQQLSARAAKAVVAPDPAVVAYPPEWVQADEVENDLRLVWDDGSGSGPAVYAQNPSSIARFELRPSDRSSSLAIALEAQGRADLRVGRRGFPRWNAEAIELLELEPAITIGTPVRLTALPPWAPDSAYLGIVEGWEDHVAPDGFGGLAWNMTLFLSDPRLSGGFGQLWFVTPTPWNAAGTVKWNTADALPN